ncbi:MAG: tetratricopeptide repeat protein [Proteobacteria bacterium]|nr:tetratricopeptide repeat protein [Pseudomonadota bacterium]
MKFGSSKLPGGKFWRYSILVFSLVWWNWLLPFSAFAAEARETVEIVITRGVLSSEKGDWAQANYLGQACYQVGDYEKSAQIFRQLLGKSPTKAEFHLSLGLALLKLGKKEDAQKEFDLAEAASEKQEKPRFWRIKLSTGTQYDSNLVLAPRDSELPGSVSHQWGIRQIFLGFGEISHSFSERVKSGLSYTYYQGLNIDLGQEDFNPREYDMLDNTFGFFASHEGKKYLARLNYSYDALLAGSSLDFYSQSHSVAPSLNYMINPSLVSYLGYEFRRDILHEPPTDPELMSQDGMSHALNLRQFVFFGPENRVTIAPEYRFKANLTAGSDYKYLGHRAGSSFDYRYLGARFSLAGAYEYRGFRNENTVQKNNGEWVKRRDDEISLRGSLGWAAKIWGVELGLNLTENFSNIEKYSYQRLLLMLGLNLTV